MMRPISLSLAFLVGTQAFASAREAKLVRYPDYHDGKVAFAYLGDIWTADEDGKNIQRLTVHTARDIHPRFSPDGRSIAFSSDREGNMDVYVIPAAGGAVKRLTIHSADDTVLDWTPDGKGILFASQRGEDFMGKLYVVSIDGGLPRDAGPDMGVAGSLLARWHQAGRQPQGPGVLAQVLPRRLSERRDRHGPGLQDLQGRDQFRRHGLVAALEPRRLHLLRQRPRRQGSDQHLARRRGRRRRPSRSRSSPAATSASRASAATARRSSSSTTSASGSSTSPAGRSSRSRSRSPPKRRRR